MKMVNSESLSKDKMTYQVPSSGWHTAKTEWVLDIIIIFLSNPLVLEFLLPCPLPALWTFLDTI